MLCLVSTRGRYRRFGSGGETPKATRRRALGRVRGSTHRSCRVGAALFSGCPRGRGQDPNSVSLGLDEYRLRPEAQLGREEPERLVIFARDREHRWFRRWHGGGPKAGRQIRAHFDRLPIRWRPGRAWWCALGCRFEQESSRGVVVEEPRISAPLDQRLDLRARVSGRKFDLEGRFDHVFFPCVFVGRAEQPLHLAKERQALHLIAKDLLALGNAGVSKAATDRGELDVAGSDIYETEELARVCEV